MKKIPFRLFFIPPLAAWTTWYCLKVGYQMEMRVLATFFFAGVFFALAIIMNTANRRRFEALSEIALIKANLLCLWNVSQIYLGKKSLMKLQSDLHAFFSALTGFLEEHNSEESDKKIIGVDLAFKGISGLNEELREAGMPSPELSRVLQWYQQTFHAFEVLTTIKEYRTPKSLRLLIDIVLTISVFILAPQFALYGEMGVFIAILVSVILVVIIRIQKSLDNPFGEDMDDLDFKFLERFEKRIAIK